MSDQEKSYQKTLNLPNTNFSMKANLVQREPQQRKDWENQDIYAQIRQARKDAPLYILHDGPPYANGDIHMGHVINKVLKDIVVKFKTMSGFNSPYIPGWDCHGLPIEAKVVAELGDKAKSMSKPEIRKLCKNYASKYVKLQSKQFKSLGIFGDFENPYLTLIPQYEKGILEIFAELINKGLVYKQLKPIHWSVGCETALADAELEYKDIQSPSVYVNFPIDKNSLPKLHNLGLADPNSDARTCLMIWTTTPWTLAANLAAAVHPRIEYVSLTYEKNNQKFNSIIAAERLPAIIKAAGLEEGQYSVTKPVKGELLEGLRYNHPFLDKNPTDKDAWFVITAEYVTTEDGTGIVHIAPGHGTDDYIAGQKYDLAVYSPVKDDGCYDDSVPDWLAGKSVLKVDPEVNAKLAELGLLVKEQKITHSYPHCWRSSTPVIFRATEQWFISVDRDLPDEKISLRNLALKSCDNVKWIPAWGQKRITGMLESRPDWCISRQRSWGLPIPGFVNSKGRVLLTTESVLAVAEHIGKKGSDSWFTSSPKEILGENFTLPEGFDFDDLQKEENIFDVWFESGCSWHSAIRMRGYSVPVDLYLEGSDQHRGWFQLSLLPALGATGKPPFKAVLTHGFTVDEHGMKQSKSLGNYVNAMDEIEKYGADILRLWVSSVNYREDMRCSDELIGRTQDSYRKIRNTMRYLFGNIDDFNPAENSVNYSKMTQIDRWAMRKLNSLIAEVVDAYDTFAFHRVYSLVYNFCTVEMSSIYMDVAKDRLYCDPVDSLSRRSCQTAMYKILDALIRLLAPVLAHTCEEAWACLPHKSQNLASVHLASMPKPDPGITSQEEDEKWDKLIALREDVLKALEPLRQDKIITTNQQAAIIISCGIPETMKLLEDFGLENFAALCIVSKVTLTKADDGLIVTAEKSPQQKCQRCWNFFDSVGKNPEKPDLCTRCIDAVKQFED